MSKAIVRCRCGHQVLAKEVLRTDLYERPTGREYVYVKYRCRRCKRMGEAFVAENRWDWSILEAQQNEMSDVERDVFADKEAISELDVAEFSYELTDIHYLTELNRTSSADDDSAAPGGLGDPANPPSVVNPAGTSARSSEPRGIGLSEDSVNGNRKRSGPDERRRQGANEEKRSEDSSSTAT